MNLLSNIAAQKRRTGSAAYRAAVLADSPASYWRMGEASGTTAADETGANPGTYVGSPTLGSAGIFPGNSAVVFNGTSQNVSAASGATFAFPNTTFAVEVWFKTSSSAFQVITAKDFGATGNGWSVYMNGGRVGAGTKGVTGQIAAGRESVLTTFANGQWHHLVAIIKTDTTTPSNNDILAIWVDGASISLTANSGSVAYVAPTTAVAIGKRDTGNFFNGTIDEVAIYPTAPSAGRVIAHYNAAGY